MSRSRRRAHKRRQRAIDVAIGRKAYKTAQDNYLDMFKEPKKPSKSFIALHDNNGECPVCFFKMEKGQRLRHNPAGYLVHHSHKKPEPKPDTFCNRCFLANPCDCD